MRHRDLEERLAGGSGGEHERTAVGWALHALEPDEEAAFLMHLPGCEVCPRVIAETTGTLEALARAVPDEEPPPRLRAAILAAAEEGPPRGESSSRERSDRAPSPNTAQHASERTGLAPVVPLRGRGRWATRAVAAAAAVVVLAAVGGAVVIRSLQDDRDEAAAAATGPAEVVRVLQEASAPGARHATLATPSGDLVGLVVDSGRGPELVTTGLATNTPDETYVLWGLGAARTATPVGLGAFDVPGTEPSAVSVPSSTGFAAYAVSLEPGRTVPAAPTEVVASGQVRQ